MRFDDRLQTVLQNRVSGEQSARTQFRQLLDILGGRQPRELAPAVAKASVERLVELSGLLPLADRTNILASVPICEANLVRWFAEQEPDIAATVLHTAVLNDQAWLRLIPELPVRARGFLRNRTDLPASVTDVLDDLGVQDRALPKPVVEEPAQPAGEPPEEAPTQSSNGDGIAQLVKRIEAFKKTRIATAETKPARTPRLESVDCFDCTLDGNGQIIWVDGPAAPALVGLRVTEGQNAAGKVRDLFKLRLPLRGTTATLEGPNSIAGKWRFDATPQFDIHSGRFNRYVGRARRVCDNDDGPAAREVSDRIRQLLHELRTPVTAIQGFAEVIQQQVFGATPHGYRALAAAIAGDSALMLAGFDEIDRLVQLESGALKFEVGESDFAAEMSKQVQQVARVLVGKVAKLRLQGLPSCRVDVTSAVAELIAWRLTASVGAAMGAGEECVFDISGDDKNAMVSCALPLRLAERDDIFSAETQLDAGPVTASMFGPGFALRLVQAEVTAVGGSMTITEGLLQVVLPSSPGQARQGGITLSDIARRAKNA